MTGNPRRPPGVFTLLLGVIVLAAGANPALAQYGMGMGMGWGAFGGFSNAPSPTNFLNQHALVAAGRGRPNPTSFRPYANSSNSYINRLRDNGFVSHYDVRRRQPPAYRSNPARSLGNTAAVSAGPRPASTVAAPRPGTTLATFFDESRKLVWPNESPVTGELREKRDVSDQASLGVLEETKRHSAASISAVTDARQKLLDYGRPALREIRVDATSRIADMFHSFLLGLYEALADAAAPPEATPGS